jgi:probable phosphoglycerate mutase
MHPIIIVRHGEAEHNVSDLTGGWTDSGLTPLGERQAAAVAERLARELKGTDVRLLSSDLKRARQTAEAIAEALGVEAAYSTDLREFNNGVAANKRREEVQELYVEPGDSLLDWQPYPGAETWRRFHLRVASYMDKVMEAQDKPFLIICHGGTVVQIVSWWLRLPIETLNWVNFHSYPTGITVLTETKWGERLLERLNDTSHLRDIGVVEPIPTEPVEKTMKH